MTPEEKRAWWIKLWDENQKGFPKEQTVSGYTGNRSHSHLEFHIRMMDILEGIARVMGHFTILDIGGGIGAVAYCLIKYCDKYTLIDNSPVSVEHAKLLLGTYSYIKIECADILNYHTDEKYNTVLMASTLQYLGDWEAVKVAMQKVYDCLEPGGRFLATQTGDLRVWRKIPDEKKADLPETEHNRLWVDPDELAEYCREIGFAEAKEVPMDPRLGYERTHMFNFRGVK